MKKIIQHLRKQPEEVKRHILHFLTVVVGIVLVILWVYSLGTNLTNQETQVKIKQDIQPFSVLKNNIVDGYKSISQ